MRYRSLRRRVTGFEGRARPGEIGRDLRQHRVGQLPARQRLKLVQALAAELGEVLVAAEPRQVTIEDRLAMRVGDQRGDGCVER